MRKFLLSNVSRTGGDFALRWSLGAGKVYAIRKKPAIFSASMRNLQW